jgi:hypothetical protein
MPPRKTQRPIKFETGCVRDHPALLATKLNKPTHTIKGVKIMYNDKMYLPCYDADVYREDLHAVFERLHVDARTAMSDGVKPEWKAADKFIITIYKVTEQNPKPSDYFGFEKLEIRVDDKRTANYIWYLCKKGITFEMLKGMHEAKQF